MPTYEYKCKACGHKFETFQSMSDEPLTACPVCEGEVERLISSGGGLIFKGSGFYTTDYRSESYRKAAKAEKSSGTQDKAKTDTKKEATAGT